MFLLNKIGKEPLLPSPNKNLSPVKRLEDGNAIQTLLGSFVLFNIAYDIYLYECPESSKKSCLLVDQYGVIFTRLCMTSHQKLATLFRYYLAGSSMIGVSFEHVLRDSESFTDIKLRSFHVIMFYFLCTLSENKTILELLHREYTQNFCNTHMVQPLQELLNKKYLQFL